MHRFLAFLLIVTAVTSPAVAATPDAGVAPQATTPGGVNETATPSNATPSRNATAPPPGDGDSSGLFGWVFGNKKEKAREESASFVQQAALTVIAGMSYVPAPNNADDWFFNPNNGMWEERWDYRQDTVMPLFWFLAAVFLLVYLLDEMAGVLPEKVRRGWFRRWRRGVVLGFFSATFAGAWLSFRRGLTMLLLQDVTAATVEAELASGVVILAALVLLITDAWAVMTLALITGSVILAIPATYPWLPVLFILGAAPSRITSLAAGLLVKAWFVLGALTLPIAALVGFGFSLEVTPHLSQSAMALSGGQYNAFMTEAVTSILTFVAKFGSLAMGVLLSHKMLGLLDLGGAAGLPQVIPQKEQVREGAKDARDRAQLARDRVGKAAGAGRTAVKGVREGRHRDAASSVRNRLGGLRSDGGTEVRDTGTGAERQDRLRNHLSEQRRDAQDRQDDSK